MTRPEVLFSLLMDLEERQVSVYAAGDRLVIHPASRLSMRLKADLRRYKNDLLREGNLEPIILPPGTVMAVLLGDAEAL